MRLLTILFVMSFLFSCKTEAPKVRLNKEERKYIDSIFSQRIPDLDTMLDSICLANRTDHYQSIKDSLISVRIKEIEAIRGK